MAEERGSEEKEEKVRRRMSGKGKEQEDGKNEKAKERTWRKGDRGTRRMHDVESARERERELERDDRDGGGENEHEEQKEKERVDG